MPIWATSFLQHIPARSHVTIIPIPFSGKIVTDKQQLIITLSLTVFSTPFVLFLEHPAALLVIRQIPPRTAQFIVPIIGIARLQFPPEYDTAKRITRCGVECKVSRFITLHRAVYTLVWRNIVIYLPYQILFLRCSAKVRQHIIKRQVHYFANACDIPHTHILKIRVEEQS